MNEAEVVVALLVGRRHPGAGLEAGPRHRDLLVDAGEHAGVERRRVGPLGVVDREVDRLAGELDHGALEGARRFGAVLQPAELHQLARGLQRLRLGGGLPVLEVPVGGGVEHRIGAHVGGIERDHLRDSRLHPRFVLRARGRFGERHPGVLALGVFLVSLVRTPTASLSFLSLK